MASKLSKGITRFARVTAAIPGKLVSGLIAAVVCVALVFLGVGVFRAGTSIQQILTENKQLEKAIRNLTDTGKIGAARVISKQLKDGKLYTKLKFWAYDRNNEHRIINEKTYEIAGDVVHFDALVVKFSDPLVKEGQKCMYIWRRVYGDGTAPEDGFHINDPNTEPVRYEDFLDNLPVNQQKLFWDSIWQLAHEPEKLEKYGIKAVYGNATYSQFQEGFLYIFRITPTGQIYPEIHRIL
jgi:hypothetical protein